jgi:hypothetical protein
VGDRGVAAAFGHQPEHVPFAVGEPIDRLGGAPSHDLGDHLRVDDGAAAQHPPDRVDELAHVGDAVPADTRPGYGRNGSGVSSRSLRARRRQWLGQDDAVPDP